MEQSSECPTLEMKCVPVMVGCLCPNVTELGDLWEVTGLEEVMRVRPL